MNILKPVGLTHLKIPQGFTDLAFCSRTQETCIWRCELGRPGSINAVFPPSAAIVLGVPVARGRGSRSRPPSGRGGQRRTGEQSGGRPCRLHPHTRDPRSLHRVCAASDGRCAGSLRGGNPPSGLRHPESRRDMWPRRPDTFSLQNRRAVGQTVRHGADPPPGGSGLPGRCPVLPRTHAAT